MFDLQEGILQDLFLPGHVDPLTLTLLRAEDHADFPGKQGFGGLSSYDSSILNAQKRGLGPSVLEIREPLFLLPCTGSRQQSDLLQVQGQV